LDSESNGKGSLLGGILRKNEVFKKKNIVFETKYGQVLLWEQSAQYTGEKGERINRGRDL
jgi:hypothetical protein